jgi:HEAT repeat protein
MAKSERWELRAIVATALATYGADQNESTLLDLVCDREWWVRYRAAESLTQCSNPDEVVERVAARNDKYALEMLRFALDKKALRSRKGVA